MADNQDEQGKDSTDDLKAKMRAALDRKKPHDDVEGSGRPGAGKGRGRGPQAQGPVGGKQMHRRKAGGGGS